MSLLSDLIKQRLANKSNQPIEATSTAEGELHASNVETDKETQTKIETNKEVEAKPIETQSEIRPRMSLKELIAQRVMLKAALETQNEEVAENLKPFIDNESEEEKPTIESEYKGAFSLSIQLNEKQLMAKDLAFQGKSFALIGAAGTGKTTAQREIAKALLEQGQLGTHNFRVQGTGMYCTGPSIAFVAYTRIAAGNLKRAVHKEPALEEALQHNITTIHNLLEYTPETYWDYEDNVEKFRFVPRRTASNPLDITHLVIEESSQVGVSDLWPKLFDALRPGVQIIFIGDINQLPPVFGASILNYALVQLPVIELDKVYRQKEGSTILDNAHKILKGEKDLTFDSNFVLVEGGKVQHTQATLSAGLMQTFKKWKDAEAYDPEQDIILSPWNVKDLGTDKLNNIIAQILGTERNAIVYEVITGMNKRYLAVGDRVLYNKQVGVITTISHNAQYYGKVPKAPSTTLSRFGQYTGSIESGADEEDFELDYSSMDIDAALDEKGEKKRQASHIVSVEMETGVVEVLSAVGDFSNQSFSLGYALTVHKAQGCEWRKVFFILHKDHAISAYRELFYTAVTRAREGFVAIAKKFMLDKAIDSQRIKGNTIAEKIEIFNSGLMNDTTVRCIK